jgi:uncharacterized protein
VKSILVDAGPLIALFDRNDQWHSSILDYMKSCNARLVTTMPVITEVCYMLGFSPLAVGDFLQWAAKGGLDVPPVTTADLLEIREILLKYQDLPADLADVSLVLLAEKLNISEVLTIDQHFDVYRSRDGRLIRNVLHK